jgi:hypothetical protein
MLSFEWRLRLYAAIDGPGGLPTRSGWGRDGIGTVVTVLADERATVAEPRTLWDDAAAGGHGTTRGFGSNGVARLCQVEWRPLRPTSLLLSTRCFGIPVFVAGWMNPGP